MVFCPTRQTIKPKVGSSNRLTRAPTWSNELQTVESNLDFIKLFEASVERVPIPPPPKNNSSVFKVVAIRPIRERVKLTSETLFLLLSMLRYLFIHLFCALGFIIHLILINNENIKFETIIDSYSCPYLY